MSNKYEEVIVEITGQIGVIKVQSLKNPVRMKCIRLIVPQFNRPKSLNSFTGKLSQETISAIRELNEHPDTVFTVLTGEGRFFSSGADVRGKLLYSSSQTAWSWLTSLCVGSGLESNQTYANDGEKKLAFMQRFTPGNMHAPITMYNFNTEYSS